MLHIVDRLKLITSPIADYSIRLLLPGNLSSIVRSRREERDLSRLPVSITRLPNRRESKDSRADGFHFFFLSTLFFQPKTLLDRRASSPLCGASSASLVPTPALPLVTRSLLGGIFQTVNCKSSNATFTVSRL